MGSSAKTTAGRRDQRPGDRDPLLLAARQLVGPVVAAVGEPDRVSSRVSSHSRSSSPPPIVSGSVMFSSAVSTGSRLKLWKTNPTASPAQQGQLAVGELVEARAGDLDPARRSAARARRGCAAAWTCPSPTGP